MGFGQRLISQSVFLLHMASSGIITWLHLAGDWLWMECPRRLFLLIRHPSAPLSGHFLSGWIVRVLTQHGGPRINGFLLPGWLIRGTFQEVQQQKFPALNHTVSLLSHSVGPSWPQGQPRFMGRAKRKRVAKNF